MKVLLLLSDEAWERRQVFCLTEDLTLLGIHSTKYELFLFCTFSICSSTSLVDMRPRKSAEAVR